MVKELLSFSDCGQYFVHIGAEGKLKVWDTVTATLKHEYSPNLHLNCPCLCLTWVSLPGNFVSPNPKRKRKLKGKNTKVIVLGTSEGTLAVFSLSEGDIISTIRDSKSTSVHAVSWSKDGGLFTVDGTNILQWDLENKSVRRKWKCKGKKVTQVAASPNGELCATGHIDINLWDVSTQECLRKFVGHSNELSSIVFINDSYFLSCGTNDRHIATWVTNSEDDKPIGRFSLGDTLHGEMSVLLENKTTLHLVAATFSGTLLYFNQQLNGKVTKSIKPSQRIELNENDSTAGSESIVHQRSMPVMCGKLTSSSTITAAYGQAPFYAFQTVSISSDREKQTISVAKPSTKHLKPTQLANRVGGGEVTEEVEYSNRVDSASAATTGQLKRKLGVNNEVTMEERLGNLCIDMEDTPGMSNSIVQNPHNQSNLLIQGLESKDRAILDSVLMNRDPKVINETVSRLPIHALVPLVQELKRMMHGRTLITIIASEWLKALLREHSGQLLADPSIQVHLAAIQSMIEARLCFLGPLSALSGRLGHVMQQLDADNKGWRNLADSLEPIVLYQEEDSENDGDSIVADGDYESEDKWDELSDQQMDSEPSS